MRYLPLHFDLQGLTVLVVGGGELARRKVDLLLRSGAGIELVAPEISDELFYVSDSNEQLLIERTREVVKHLGLSVLAPSANESFVIQAWIDMKTQASNPQ
mgnify:CR=1 FL=1